MIASAIGDPRPVHATGGCILTAGTYMTSTKTIACLFLGAGLCLAQPQPPSKAPDQGYVPAGWMPHEGGLLKYRVAIRFGEEPDTMPDGW